MPPRTQPFLPRQVIFSLLVTAAVGIPVMLWLAGVIFRVETPVGTLVIDVDQPAVEVFINDKRAVLKVLGGGEPIAIEVHEGKHELKVSKGGFETFTQRFTVKAGGHEAVKVHLEPLAMAAKKGPPNATLADRLAIEWVLKMGGTVWIDVFGESPREIQSADTLPAGPLRLVQIRLANQPLADVDFDRFKALPGLRILQLPRTGVRDEALHVIGELKTLQSLGLQQCPITDQGLESLKDLRAIESLFLDKTKITGSGFGFLKDLPKLQVQARLLRIG